MKSLLLMDVFKPLPTVKAFDIFGCCRKLTKKGKKFHPEWSANKNAPNHVHVHYCRRFLLFFVYDFELIIKWHRLLVTKKKQTEFLSWINAVTLFSFFHKRIKTNKRETVTIRIIKMLREGKTWAPLLWVINDIF